MTLAPAPRRQESEGFTALDAGAAEIVLSMQSHESPHCFAAVEFYKLNTDGTGYAMVMPTAGTATFTVQTTNLRTVFQALTGGGVVDFANVAAGLQVNWNANTERVKAVMLGITGNDATHCKLIVSCNPG